MPGDQRWTSRHVAALAGVSVATVSYVMNGRMSDRIPEATKGRVLSAARQLGYSPNRSARSLRRRKTEQVCLVVDSIGVPSNDQLARALHARADEVGYGVVTMVVDSPDRAEKTVDLLHQRLVDGAAVAPSINRQVSDEALAGLARGGLPLVVMSNTAIPAGFDVVRAPEAQACDEALDHLYSSGCRRVAYVGHQAELTDAAVRNRSERLNAYLAARERHGAEADDSLIVEGADGRVAAYQSTRRLLARPDRPDAVFTASGRAGVSALWAVRDEGLAVPDNIAVVGCGNLPESLITQPPLSTVGAAAADFTDVSTLLFERLLATEPLPVREITTPWVFTNRGSS
jgi:LacI family transcriptional regulator